MSDQRNLLWALVLSLAVLLAWDYWQRNTAPPPAPTASDAQGVPDAPHLSVPALAPAPARAVAARIPLANDRLVGSISLYGARIDDLTLTTYGETPDPDSPRIRLFVPDNYFAQLSWVRSGTNPAPILFEAPAGQTLAPDQPVYLTAQLEGGLTLQREISLDDAYLFTIRDVIRNETPNDVLLAPQGNISRLGQPEISGYFLLHEGMIGVFSGSGLEEIDYDDVLPNAPSHFISQGGYLGFTDKYWAAALILPQETRFDGSFSAFGSGENTTYLAGFDRAPFPLKAGEQLDFTHHLFAGAKEVALLDGYEASIPAPQLDLLINWGWFYFLTKPFFQFLNWLFHLTGNFGIAILLATIAVKLVFFPLANMSYKALAHLRRLQPEIEAVRERFGDDRSGRDQALMKLYRESGANPAAGCFPLIIQIPVFFAIYKVLFVTIEMRHTPFYGWIQDLAAPDPTSLFNLFGLLPFPLPDFMIIGIWPLLMGLTMWVQMQLNPPPPDPIQRRIFTLFPLITTLILARFPAGLVIYWAWNNLLSILQQAYIMKRHGADIALLDNFTNLWKKDSSKP